MTKASKCNNLGLKAQKMATRLSLSLSLSFSGLKPLSLQKIDD